MKKTTVFWLMVCLVLASCGGGTAFKKYDTDFVGNRWQKSDVRTYDFTLKESGTYDLMVDFSHVYGTQFPALPLNVVMVNPDMSKKTQSMMLELRDPDGTELGDCSGDYCDVRQAAFSKMKLAAGNYQVSVANDFEYDFVPNVLGFGIRIVKSED